MKQKIMIYVLLITTIAACKRPDNSCEYAYVRVIRFEKPSYKEHIIVELPAIAWNKQLKMNTVGYDMPAWCYGQPPYYELGDGYLLIDWKWVAFYTHNHTALVTQTWDELTNIHSTWPTNDLYARNPIAETIIIREERFNDYQREVMGRGSLPSSEFPRMIDNNFPIFSLADSTWVTYIDSLQSENAEVFRHMIRNGHLERFREP